MNENEFYRYIEMYRKKVWSAAMCYVKNVSDADDITQDVFLKLYTYTGEFESDDHVKHWLIRCAVNMSINLLRSHWYKKSVPLDEALGKEYYDKTDEGREITTEMFMKLSSKNSTALYLYYYEGYSTEEIASMLGISETAVQNRLMRGRNRLKELITEERMVMRNDS
ncbi:MAG: RNA polymerase sigma factor [Ruminiclostridium sp.]|nr:RNA polymerase sigma factor [Ruminiclostridium sp.]